MALGRHFQAAGHEVRLISLENYETLVRTHSLNFHPIPGDARAILRSSSGQAIVASGRHGVGPSSAPRKQLTAGRLAVAIDQMVTDETMRGHARAARSAYPGRKGVAQARIAFESEVARARG